MSNAKWRDKQGGYTGVGRLALGCILSFLVFAAQASATDYSAKASGNWNDVNTWNPSSGYPGSGDTASIDFYSVTANVAIASDIVLIDVLTNGTLYISTSLTNDMRLSGGIIAVLGGDFSLYGNISVACSSLLSPGWNQTLRVYGVVSNINSGVMLGGPSVAGHLYLYSNAPNSSIAWNLTEGGEIRLYAPLALGTGTVSVGTGSGAQLNFYTSATNVTGPLQFLIGPSGSIIARGSVTNDYGNDPITTISNGTLSLEYSAHWRDPIYIPAEATGTISMYDHAYIDANITGSGTLVFPGTAGEMYFTATNSGFTGLLDIRQEILELSGTNALHCGPIMLEGTRYGTLAELYLNNSPNVDWVFTNALSGVGRIKVEDGSNTLTLLGITVDPGLDSAAGGILEIWGKLEFVPNGASCCTLKIDVVNSELSLSSSYDSFRVDAGTAALAASITNVDLVVDFHDITLNGQIPIMYSPDADFSPYAFHSVTWLNGGPYSITYAGPTIYLNYQGAVYNDVASGNWSSPAIWTPQGVPGTGDTVIIDGYQVTADVNISTNITLVNVTTNYISPYYTTTGKLVLLKSPEQTNNIRLTGGKLDAGAYEDWAHHYGVVEIADSSTFDMSMYHNLYLHGAMTALAPGRTLTKTGVGQIAICTNPAPGFDCSWDIRERSVIFYSNQGIGTGALVSVGGYATDWPPWLELSHMTMTNPANVLPGPAAFVINTNGTIRLNGYDGLCIVDYSNNPTLTINSGGTLNFYGTDERWCDPVVINGDVAMSGGYGAGRVMNNVSGAGTIKVSCGWLYFYGTNRNYAGTLELADILPTLSVVMDNTNALPGGPIACVSTGAYLRLGYPTTDVDWTLTNAISGRGTIVVGDGTGTRKMTLGGNGSLSPGVASTAAGTLTVDGDLAFATNGSTYAQLDFDIIGAGTNDQLVIDHGSTNTASSLTNCNITVNLGDLGPENIPYSTIFTNVIASGGVNFSGYRFNSVTWNSTRGMRGRVCCNADGTITIKYVCRSAGLITIIE